MKVTAYADLIILLAALIVGVPLFLACNAMINGGLGLTYLEDKSVWKIEDDIDWIEDDDGNLVPDMVIDPICISQAQLAVMPYIQDEYTPNGSRDVYKAFAAIKADGTTADGTDVCSGPGATRMTSKPNSRPSWFVSSDHNIFMNSGLAGNSNTDKRYLVWNYRKGKWMVTTHVVDIYAEVR